jgi:hypothetical protein
MKTLVIHPQDPTTDFLKEIYRDKGYTVINHDPKGKELIQAIKSHGRIMMMGHGVPMGLIGHGRLIINSKHVYLLREKLCVGIWCNADQFFNKYKLRGFFTGMFISEVMEAAHYGISITQEKVTYSNEYFASEFRKYEDMICVHQLIKSHYNSFDCPVIQFNNDRLYERDEAEEAYDTMVMESNLAARDLEEEMRDFTDDLSDDEQSNLIVT